MTDSGYDGLPGLAGEIGTVVLVDNCVPVNNVVDGDRPFQVRISWRVRPPMVATVLDGTWTVDLYVGSTSAGAEVRAGSVDVAATGVTTYTATITVPPGRLTADGTPAPASGVHKLVEVLTYRNQLGTRTAIAAFAEGPTFLLTR